MPKTHGTTKGGVADGDKGDITVSSSGTVWTIDANAVSLSKLAQLAALSVLGNPTNGVANMSAITATVNGQFLRCNSGTSLAWSTLILPNTATQYYVPYATAANTIGESGNLQFNGTNFSIGGTADSHRMKIAAGTITDLKSALYISATLPTVITGDIYAVDYQVTSAGSSSFNQAAMQIGLLAGYTGSSRTEGLVMYNTCQSTNTGIFAQAGNIGFTASTSGTTTGANKGCYAFAANGNRNSGLYGRATTAKSGALNIGVSGIATNTSGTQVGGFFCLSNASTYIPAVSGALMCDNAATTSDIFVARDNGTTKWSIVDGGNTTWADAVNMVFGTSTGTKIGTATSQKIGIWNATPIVQPTTAIAAATFVANTSAIANDTATFDGYTIGQVVKALRNFGILA